jgi:hypothetical protein
MEWLNMFSGGLDIIPVMIGVYLIYIAPMAARASSESHRVAYYLSVVMAICMIVAQTGWVYAVTQGVYLLGTAFDNIWLVVNTLAVVIPLIFAHDQISRAKK